MSVKVYMSFFHSNWLTRSRPMDSKCSHLLPHWHLCSSHRGCLSPCWRWEMNRPGTCAAQTQTGSKEGILSHLRTCPLVWKRALLWQSTDHYQETTVQNKRPICFVHKHEERRENMIITKISTKDKNSKFSFTAAICGITLTDIVYISVTIAMIDSLMILNSLEKENSRLD